MICVYLPGKQISLVICVPPTRKHISLVICVPPPGKHISLVICVPPPWKHTSLVICVPPPWKHISLVMCVPYSQWLSQSWIIRVKRNFVPKGWQVFFFCFAFLIEPFVLWFGSRFQSDFFAFLHQRFTEMLSCLTAATNLDWTVYINSDMSSLAAPPGNTCQLLSLILLLLKIFVTTLPVV